ncbi:aspartic peptidase domain-containing protein [Zychaea mexicana]|uniref:aspartic peptidase domain-containing protein n=1 Tax=Zychaea mexicana TaxID=64656 RepID=UPI0022FF184A|nr:aspartic peptidase domain-containing protein [Zychaea mexicana]KAI9484638.1 aspartic peptidase domain-containing protein [Zychaea mexicana]
MMVPLLALLQFIFFASHMADAISIEDMIFPSPAYTGDKPPSVPLIFKGGVPTADFAIGTPPQNFTGVLDTGSPITWVMSTECRDTGCENVPMSEKFNRAASTTNTAFPSEIELSYLDGTHVHLKPELDTVTLAETYKFPHHLIGEATMVGYPAGFVPAANARIGVGDYSNDILDPKSSKMSKDFNAPVGASLQRRAAGDAHTSTGPTASGSPSFRKRDPNASDNFLWILGDDPSMYTGPLYRLALISGIDSKSSPFWKVPLKGLALQESKKELTLSGGFYGTVSSSTPYIMVPPSMASALNDAIGAKYQAKTRMYTISCAWRKKLPSLVVEFSQGLDAQIPASQYINEYEHIPTGQSEACFSTIVNGPDDHTVYLGGPFFRSYYLGFAVTEKALYVAQSAANTGATLASNGAADQDSTAPALTNTNNPQTPPAIEAPPAQPQQPNANALKSPSAAPQNGGTAAPVGQNAPSSQQNPGSSIGGQDPGSSTAAANNNVDNEMAPNGGISNTDANPTQPSGGNHLKDASVGANPDAATSATSNGIDTGANPGLSTDGSGITASPMGANNAPSGKLAPTSPNQIAPEGSTVASSIGSSPGQAGDQPLN